jgi:hypothetical protein
MKEDEGIKVWRAHLATFGFGIAGFLTTLQLVSAALSRFLLNALSALAP